MDSGSTALLVLLIVSTVIFLGAHAVETALPLIRRSNVRDALPERGLREAAIRRLRSGRSAYQETVSLFVLASASAVSASSLALFVRLTDWGWVYLSLIVAGLWLALVALLPLVRVIVSTFSVGRLMVAAVVIQLGLWPFVPLASALFRLWQPAPEPTPTQVSPVGTAERAEEAPPVEEQIQDEPLDPRERAMIGAILQLEETPVREIMVPRVDVYAIEVTASLEEAGARMLEGGHSRLPVYKETLDNVIGVLYSLDLLAAAASASGSAMPTLRTLARPPFFVPESKRVDEMLAEFQERRVQIAIVVDEYGGVAGILTLEDLLEEIVGEIEDEFDVQEPVVEHRPNGEVVVDARMPVDEFNEAFNADIGGGGFDTLGGFISSRLGRLPTVGDTVESSGLRIEVLNMIGRRLKRVLVRQAEPVSDDSSSSPA